MLDMYKETAVPPQVAGDKNRLPKSQQTHNWVHTFSFQMKNTKIPRLTLTWMLTCLLSRLSAVTKSPDGTRPCGVFLQQHIFLQVSEFSLQRWKENLMYSRACLPTQEPRRFQAVHLLLKQMCTSFKGAWRQIRSCSLGPESWMPHPPKPSLYGM